MRRRETIVSIWYALVQDVQLSFRMFSREKVWTALAVVTLGIGIGANSALFSIVNATLIRALPYPEPDRILSITTAFDGVEQGNTAETTYAAWKARAQSFSALAAYRRANTVMKGPGDPESIDGRRVTYGYFPVYGLHPILGRVFGADEHRPGTPRVVILAEQTWRRIFNGDSSVIGRTVLMDDDPATVIGVMPAALNPGGATHYWEPFGQAKLPGWVKPTYYVYIVGRLAPSATIASARAELLALTPPPSDPKVAVTPVVMTAHERRFGDRRPTLLMLFAAVGVLLLIACANVANLLLARATRREREFAVRAAIGASHWRLIRFLLSESTLIGLMGAVLGLGLARLTLDAFVALGLSSVVGTESIAIDGTVAAFSFVVAFVTAQVFGLVPALHVRRLDLNTLLADTARGTTGSRQAWMRRALVVGELAVALMLVTGAGLLMKSFFRITGVPTVVDPGRAIVADMRLSSVRYGEPPAAGKFFERFTTAVSAIPGVEAIALAYHPPLSGPGTVSNISLDDRPAHPLGGTSVTRQFFRAAGIELIAGREFDATDVKGSEPVAVLNETAAKVFGDGTMVVGKRLALGDPWQPPYRIIGVARDIPHVAVEEAPRALMYTSMEQEGDIAHFANVVVRTKSNPAPVMGAMRDITRQLDGRQPLPRIRTLQQQLDEEVAPRRFTFALLTAFAAVGAILAMIGLYGVMSYLIAERTSEIGVRVAMGADPGRIMRFVVGEGMLLITAGVVLGLIGSLGGVRLLRTMLYRMDVYDPAIFVAAAVLLIITALVACAAPARRATQLDPLEALRR